MVAIKAADADALLTRPDPSRHLPAKSLADEYSMRELRLRDYSDHQLSYEQPPSLEE